LRPYWTSANRARAFFVLGVLIVLTLGGSGIGAGLTSISKDFYDAIEKRDQIRFWRDAGVIAIMFSLMASVGAFTQWLRQWQEIRWRRELTHDLVGRWLSNNAFYRIERTQAVDNTDQRISDDAKLFVENTLELGLSFISNVGTLVLMGAILWMAASPLKIGSVTIPGYLFFVAILYGLFQVFLVHFVGRRMTPLTVEQQRREADFRFALAQQREGAEQIAFYRGAVVETSRLHRLFEAIAGNWAQLMTANKRVTFTLTVLTMASTFVPLFAMAPKLFASEVNIGGMMQSQAAFASVVMSISWFAINYPKVAGLSAVTRRLIGLNQALDAQDPPGVQVRASTQPRVETWNLRLSLPNGAVLSEVGDWNITNGQQWIVRGPSGVGKSTLMRAVAGLWPYGAGTLTLPSNSRMMFLPQKSYIPPGSLKEALCYPSSSDKFEDGTCRQALIDCKLPQLATRLDESTRWSQRLSVGEQQRLAFARALLAKPDFLFLDEATSALDEDTETAMYELLRDRLPSTTIVSVAHHVALERFHNRSLMLQPGQHAQQSTLVAAVA